MSSLSRVGLGVVALLAWTAAVPGSAQESSAADVARAENFASAAFEAYGRKEYAEAVVLYKQALDAAPSADIVYNLARIHDTKLKDRKLAIEYYRRYTLDTGADPSRLRTASLRLAELVELESIAAEAPERRASTNEVRAPMSLDEPSPPPAAKDESLSGLTIAGIVTGSAGVIGLGVGVGFGVAAKSKVDVAHDFCNGNACRTQRGLEAAKDASRAATVSTVAFVAGGVLAALGITFLVAGGGGESEAAGVSFAPYLDPLAVGTNVQARF